MKNALGYILGFLVFVAGIPALMWWVSGRPFPWAPALPWAVIALLLIIPGLALSIWSIVHMKKVGEGIFYIGVLLWLMSWWPLAVFAVEVLLLTLQVRSEEKRLEADFGDEYLEYKKRVPRYLLHV